MSIYREHRDGLLGELATRRAAGIFFTGHPPIRNNDCEYRFRPHSDFWYLTGFAEPDSVLVLVPNNEGGEGPKSVLFLRPRVREEEIWNGLRLGVERAVEHLGVDAAHPMSELWSMLPKLLVDHDAVVYANGDDSERDRRVTEVLATLRRRVRGGVTAPLELLHPSLVLHERRLKKSEGELKLIRRAVEITTEAHVAAMRETAPGVNEAEIDALLDYTFRKNGSTGQSYNNIVAGGANACILHYIENDQPLKDGDLLLIDAGAEWDYYASDVTRTFPVNGTFSAEQRAIYEVVLAAEKAGIEQVGPGNTFESVHDRATEVLVQGLLDLGLLQGTLEEALESESYKRFYMHRTGHWLGLDVHDCGRYHLDGESRPLEPGMITTVEPGIYVARDDETVEERWRGIGIRIEDDVLCTADGREVLTAAIPKEIDEVEAACAGATLAAAAR